MSNSANPVDRVVFRTCPLCEATCGLQIEVRDGAVARIRGDRDDVFSHGFLCPKGSTLKQLHEDPDRLRRPLVRTGVGSDGEPIFAEVSWDEAYAVVAERLADIRSRYGNESIGVYLGNPNVHNLGAGTHNRPFLKALGARSMFSASTVDQMPRHVASGYLYGSGGAMPVPDLDRTDLLVILGSNPLVSNGSICTAPGFGDRMKAIQDRGGRVIVIDPSRTATAATADLHLAIRPGTDAVLLAAVVRLLLAAGPLPETRVLALVDGVAELRESVEPFTPELAATVCGVEAASIVALAAEIGGATRAAVHGRLGTTTVEFGTLTTWLIDVVSIVTGNLDEPGGAMFPRSATERVRAARPGRDYQVGRWTSRVNGNPEVQGELPAADLPDEILVPGDGQLRMMFTVAGNPVLSCPDSRRMDEALADVEAMVSVDIYLNETTRHADVILPPADALEKSHYDLAFYGLSIRNVANYSPPVFASDQPAEDEIMARLTLLALGMDATDPKVVDDQLVDQLLASEVIAPGSPVFGRDPEELAAMVTGERGSDRVLDVLVRTGAYGDGFGAVPDGLSLEWLLAHPHGCDLGALEPRLPELISTASGRINLFAGPFGPELERLALRVGDWANDDRLLLVGRRHLRSNNSWMHNLEVLVRGRSRCTLQVNPVDAAKLGLVNAGQARVRSEVGEVAVEVEVTDVVMPGVVSLPHGWGHGVAGTKMAVAARYAGVNSNLLTDPSALDPLSGTSVLNAIPVEVELAHEPGR
jgi:anaerobic selenocysteine-containing dehydrogenase